MKFSKVTVRKKKLSKGRISLYLDFYPAVLHPETGQETRREFLHLHYKEKPRTEKEQDDKEACIKLAEKIRHDRETQIRSGQAGLTAIKGRGSFLVFFEAEAERQEGSTKKGYVQTLHHLKEYLKGKDASFNSITLDTIEGFKSYLLTKAQKRTQGRTGALTSNTVGTYESKVLTVCRRAFIKGFMSEDLSLKIKRSRGKAKPRHFLSLEELSTLAKTPCDPEYLKRAALFSALTGLRFCDIDKMIWEEVEDTPNGPCVRLIEQKTKTPTLLPISESARAYLGERRDPAALVFPQLKYSFWLNTKLRDWLVSAGILKRFTFHMFRHTFATLQLNAGTDIYTLSKMLGHKDIATTEIYAKLLDEKKREAAERIKLDI